MMNDEGGKKRLTQRLRSWLSFPPSSLPPSALLFCGPDPLSAINYNQHSFKATPKTVSTHDEENAEKKISQDCRLVSSCNLHPSPDVGPKWSRPIAQAEGGSEGHAGRRGGCSHAVRGEGIR